MWIFLVARRSCQKDQALVIWMGGKEPVASEMREGDLELPWCLGKGSKAFLNWLVKNRCRLLGESWDPGEGWGDRRCQLYMSILGSETCSKGGSLYSGSLSKLLCNETYAHVSPSSVFYVRCKDTYSKWFMFIEFLYPFISCQMGTSKEFPQELNF